jgi:hypothetical protein
MNFNWLKVSCKGSEAVHASPRYPAAKAAVIRQPDCIANQPHFFSKYLHLMRNRPE